MSNLSLESESDSTVENLLAKHWHYLSKAEVVNFLESNLDKGLDRFDNLVKFITWTLPTNVSARLLVLVAVLFGRTLPITPVKILWINMTTVVLLGLMLAFEKREPGLMLRRPRDPATPVITRELVFRIALVSIMLLVSAFGLFNWVLQTGKSLETARTLAVNMFKLGVFSNGWLLLGVLAMSVFQLIFTCSTVMNQLFGSTPLSGFEWLLRRKDGVAYAELEK